MGSPIKVINKGEVFGRWTVIGERISKNGESHYPCRCKCGKVKEIFYQNLIKGKSKSCGCGKGHQPIHGMSETSTYAIWCAMKFRCYNPKSPAYKNYGGRGIKVCDRWLHSFENFFADMGERPSKSHSIDRINNDVGYCQENCRWATFVENNHNRRNSRHFYYKGKNIHVSELSKKTGIKAKTIIARIDVRGWSIDKAIETPPRKITSKK